MTAVAPAATLSATPGGVPVTVAVTAEVEDVASIDSVDVPSAIDCAAVFKEARVLVHFHVAADGASEDDGYHSSQEAGDDDTVDDCEPVDLGAIFLVDEVHVTAIRPLEVLFLAEVDAVGVWDRERGVLGAVVEYLDHIGAGVSRQSRSSISGVPRHSEFQPMMRLANVCRQTSLRIPVLGLNGFGIFLDGI